MSAGSRSLENWMRENWSPSSCASAWASVVSADTGQVLDQEVAAGEQAGEREADLAVLPRMMPSAASMADCRRDRASFGASLMACGGAGVGLIMGLKEQ